MASAFNKFACFAGDVAAGLHNLATGTPHDFRVYLTNTPPSAANTVFGTPAEIATGHGYVAGGLSLGAVVGVNTNGLFTFSAGVASLIWTATGGAIGPFQWPVLYNFTSPTKPLIGWWDFGSPISIRSTATFTETLPAPIFSVQ